jgi:hypothetical protein
MVFDVESIGLHGEGFAVAYVVVDRNGHRHAEGLLACPPASARGRREGHRWVEDNVPALGAVHRSPESLRTAFWGLFLSWHELGALLVADCGWPVEARFLAQCVDDDLACREWLGPYPLHDLASILLAKGKDPLEKRTRLTDELPEHNPLADARQSARLLVEAMRE